MREEGVDVEVDEEEEEEEVEEEVDEGEKFASVWSRRGRINV